jgi:hypothetical protein
VSSREEDAITDSEGDFAPVLVSVVSLPLLRRRDVTTRSLEVGCESCDTRSRFGVLRPN